MKNEHMKKQKEESKNYNYNYKLQRMWDHQLLQKAEVKADLLKATTLQHPLKTQTLFPEATTNLKLATHHPAKFQELAAKLSNLEPMDKLATQPTQQTTNL